MPSFSQDLLNPHEISGLTRKVELETIGIPLVSIYVQELQDDGWQDRVEFNITNDGSFVVPWVYTEGKRLRVKAYDEMGNAYISNQLRFREPTKISLNPECISTKNREVLPRPAIEAKFTKNLQNISKLVFYSSPAEKNNWSIYNVTDLDTTRTVLINDTIYTQNFPSVNLDGSYYDIRMDVFNEYGDLIRSLETRYPYICFISSVETYYQPATECNTLSPGIVSIHNKYEKSDFINIDGSKLFIGERIEFKDFSPKDIPANQILTTIANDKEYIDINTSTMQEGVYPLVGEYDFSYGSDTYTIKYENAYLIVDRNLPRTILKKPQEGENICSIPVVDQHYGNISNVTPVVGNADDIYDTIINPGYSFSIPTSPDIWHRAPKFDTSKSKIS